MTGIIMGNVKLLAVVDVTFDAASVSANTSAEQSVTVPGAKVGDFVRVCAQTATAGLSYGNSRVTAADTVAVTYVNSTASPINPASMTLRFFIARPEVVGATTFGV